MLNQITLFTKRFIRITYSVICFLAFFIGIYHIVSFRKRNEPIILMYHSVNSRSCPYVYPDNIVTVENFKRQITYLIRKKRIISLSELGEMIKNGSNFPPNLVAITFDDGYYDFYSIAYPFLKEHNISCTMFPVTGTLNTGEAKSEDRLAYLVNTASNKSFTIHTEGKLRKYDIALSGQKINCIRDVNSFFLRIKENGRFNILQEIEGQLGQPYKAPEQIVLSWKEVVELDRSGLVSFGCHTHNHSNLADLSLEMAEVEVSRSKELLEKFLGKPCSLFSYPFGRRRNFNQEIKGMLRTKGFLLAVSTLPGRISKNPDTFELKRIQVLDDSSYKFKCSLIGITLQRP